MTTRRVTKLKLVPPPGQRLSIRRAAQHFGTDPDSDSCACFPFGRRGCPDYSRRMNEAAISQGIPEEDARD